MFMITAQDFYYRYSKCNTTFPKIPSNVKSNTEVTKWIFKENIPYINLNLNFDTKVWQKEMLAAEDFYVLHRESQSHLGWKSCCIHGIDVDKTGVWQCYTDKEPKYNWTKLSKLTPTITQFCNQLPFEKLARVRFMKLDPGGWIEPHNDSPLDIPNNFSLLDHLIPINIAIDHPEDCFMTLKDFGVVPWSNGKAKIVNITNDHSVINFSKSTRIHLIVHGWIGNKIEEFSELIANSYKAQV